MDLTPDTILEYKCDNCQKEDGIKVKVCDLLDNPDSYEIACQNCGCLIMINTKPFHKMFVDAGIQAGKNFHDCIEC